MTRLRKKLENLAIAIKTRNINDAHKYAKNTILILAGTSLTVYPASGLINFYNGSKLIVINREKTQYNRKGNLVINESLGKIFKEI